MPAKYTYLLIDLGALLVPLLFSFHPRLRFYTRWRAFVPANLIVTLLFVGWDILYTHLGVWGFNDRYLLGPRLAGLPVEEILFFVCIPFSSLFTYHCFRLLAPTVFRGYEKGIATVLILLLMPLGLFFYQKLYTGATFLLLAAALGWLLFKKKTGWLHSFFFMYLIILLPFFVVNGLLTGTGLQEPVVWYNNAENLGIRLLTIPVEDVFYGMLLLLLNTGLFEYFGKRGG